MKKSNLKKYLSLAAALALTVSLSACSNGGTGGQSDATPTPAPVETKEPGQSAGDGGYKIAIVQQLDHASLDEIRKAIEAELDAKEAELGIEITYEEYFGQNDPTLLGQIGDQVAAGGFDAVIPIASMAAQYMVTATEDSGIPVVYAAISDPETATLTGIDRVTGTSDALNTPFILDMMFAQNPEISSVGLLYSTSEPNSTTPIAQAKEYLESKNIKIVEKTGNSTDEVISAVNSMLDQVDAIFTPTDNVIMAAELAIAPTLAEAGIPHYTGADSFVRNGAFATCGVNYTELGTYTADMTLDVLRTGSVPEYHVMDGGIITVNTETAAALGADYSVFQDLAATVNEVATTVD